ncbi:procathepsin L-like [Osmerus eperlanus]|uniref:procathepsin L-like n=1 Tax=Osmerus eperlanus TaxID=29151 RepID=UPI002E0F7453
MQLRVLCLFAWHLLIFVVAGHYISDLNEQWEKWKDKYQKSYGNKVEDLHRRIVWEKNLRLVHKHNEETSTGQHSFTMGVNHLTDMTAEEVNILLNGLKQEDLNHDNWISNPLMDIPLPMSVDWRERGMVSPVQNQGMCGSCWAFSSIGALEGQMKRRNGSLVPLSPQNLVDCSTRFGNHGCKGGYLSKSYLYVISNRGIDSESFYPYEHKDGQCRYSTQGKAGVCFGFHILPQGMEGALQVAVATVGPVAVGINAMLPSFHHYRGGLYNDPACSPKITNHAVLVVGYGSDKGQDFWLVKNSWGTGWGEKGFIRIGRNQGNLCGISNFAIYPTM